MSDGFFLKMMVVKRITVTWHDVTYVTPVLVVFVRD